MLFLVVISKNILAFVIICTMLLVANNKEETLALGLEFLMGIRTIQVSKCFVPPSHPLDSILSAHCFVNPQVLDIVIILRKIGIKMCLSKLIFLRVLGNIEAALLHYV